MAEATKGGSSSMALISAVIIAVFGTGGAGTLWVQERIAATKAEQECRSKKGELADQVDSERKAVETKEKQAEKLQVRVKALEDTLRTIRERLDRPAVPNGSTTVTGVGNAVNNSTVTINSDIGALVDAALELKPQG